MLLRIIYIKEDDDMSCKAKEFNKGKPSGYASTRISRELRSGGDNL